MSLKRFCVTWQNAEDKKKEDGEADDDDDDDNDELDDLTAVSDVLSFWSGCRQNVFSYEHSCSCSKVAGALYLFFCFLQQIDVNEIYPVILFANGCTCCMLKLIF